MELFLYSIVILSLCDEMIQMIFSVLFRVNYLCISEECVILLTALESVINVTKHTTT